MHTFTYRAPRVDCRIPVEFVTDAGTLQGHSRNIGDQGLLLDLREPVAPSTNGRVRLRFEQCMLELEAQVSHSEAFTVGLVFQFANPKERWFVHAFVQALEAAHQEAFSR